MHYCDKESTNKADVMPSTYALPILHTYTSLANLSVESENTVAPLHPQIVLNISYLSSYTNSSKETNLYVAIHYTLRQLI